VRGAAWALEKTLADASGPAEIIEGKHGFLRQVSGPLAPEAFAGLGQRFLIADTYIKQYAVEYHGQTIVEHALCLREELGAPAASQVREVLIRGYEAQERIIGDESKRRPSTKETADHSLYYVFAAPFVEGEMTARQYRPELLASAEVLGVIDRTRFEEVPAWTAKYFASQAERAFVSSAKVTLTGGRVASHELAYPHGHPKNPMSDAEVEAKFLRQAGPFLAAPAAAGEALWHLDEAKSVAALLAAIKMKPGI
jgi:2-methylcitrate dehydratase